MTVQRFVGATSREAMRQVKAVLGNEALILANRNVEGGIEILAIGDDQPTTHHPENAVTHLEEVVNTTRSAQQEQSMTDITAMSLKLRHEMHEMRELLAKDQPGLQPPANDQPNTYLQDLLSLSGFSSELTQELVTAMPPELGEMTCLEAPLLGWLNRQLAMRIKTPGSVDQLLGEGGVVALIGPTGVGKTTTTAKLAAQYVMRHGPEKVALVSTDSYRVGAHEQLRVYANLLGVDLHALESGENVAQVLDGISNKHLILVDTIGLSQRDARMNDHIAALQQAQRPVKLVLLLNTASQPQASEEVIANYRRAASANNQIIDCILTKIDEAVVLGPSLDMILRREMRTICVSNGQRVPEDIEDPSLDKLLHQALSFNDPSIRASAPPTVDKKTPNLLLQGRHLKTTMQLLRQNIAGFSRLEKIWELGNGPVSLQQQLLDEMINQCWPLQGQDLAVLWQPPASSGGFSQPLPDLLMDSSLGYSAAVMLQHRHPADSIEKLARCKTQYGVTRHIFSALPDAACWQWLHDNGQTWCSPVQAGLKGYYAGELMSVSALTDFTDEPVTRTVSYRGESANLMLSRVPVKVQVNRRRREEPVFSALCWFGELRDPKTDIVISRRYWLTPEQGDHEALLVAQLSSDSVSSLAKRAWQQLGTVPGFDSCRDLRLVVATSLAAIISQVEQEKSEWGMDLRAQLQGFTGGKRRYSTRMALDALLYLMAARDVFEPGYVS